MIDKIKADLIAKMHYESVLKFCLVKLNHNSHDAKDITQEVFLLFQEKCDTLDDNNIRSWLLKVADLKIKEYHRSLKKEMDNTTIDELDIEDEVDNICSLLDECNRFDSDNIEKYRNIVFEKLNQKDQTLYQKHFIENKSNKQIAEEMNTNAKNVSVMLSRLRKKLNLMEALVICTVGQVILTLFF